MPIYEYRCAQDHVTDAYRTVDARHDCPPCDRCGASTEKIISRPSMTMPDIAGYRSTIDGTWIGSRSSHRDHLATHGVVEVGNERLPDRKPVRVGGVREDIHRAIAQLRN